VSYSFEQWYAAIGEQPELPNGVPAWLADLVTLARGGSIHAALNDPSRHVPEADPEGAAPRYSAVLIALSGDPDFVPTDDQPVPDDAAVILTHRHPQMRTHAGQIAFPGGAWESQDATPVNTAVREAQEETGLDPGSLKILAVLDPVYIERTNFAVVPVLAYWYDPHRIYPATEENDWVAPVPINELLDPTRRYGVGFLNWTGPAFDVSGMVLWGFTAGVLSALLRVAGWEQPWSATPHRDLFEVLENSKNGEVR